MAPATPSSSNTLKGKTPEEDVSMEDINFPKNMESDEDDEEDVLNLKRENRRQYNEILALHEALRNTYDENIARFGQLEE